MRRRSFSVSLCLLLLLTTAPAFAAEPNPAGTAPVPPKSADGKTQIVTDEKAHVVRVFIDGKEVLAIDAKGLHVKGDIAYSGVTQDDGDTIKLP